MLSDVSLGGISFRLLCISREDKVQRCLLVSGKTRTMPDLAEVITTIPSVHDLSTAVVLNLGGILHPPNEMLSNV